MNGWIRLGEVAHARSGDKGNHANIGVIAYTAAGYEYLQSALTSELVAQHFAAWTPRGVDRFLLPGIGAMNFVLYDILAGGASRSLRTDTQGKVLAPSLLSLWLPEPTEMATMRK